MRRFLLPLTALAMFVPLLSGCVAPAELMPIGEAEAGHAGFDCPARQYVVGFDATGQPKCRVLSESPTFEGECGPEEFPYPSMKTGVMTCMTYVEFFEQMGAMPGQGYGDVHEHGPASITALMLAGDIDRQLVNASDIQLRVTGECATGAIQRIHENGVVDCSAPSGSTDATTGSALVVKHVVATGDHAMAADEAIVLANGFAITLPCGTTAALGSVVTIRGGSARTCSGEVFENGLPIVQVSKAGTIGETGWVTLVRVEPTTLTGSSSTWRVVASSPAVR